MVAAIPADISYGLQSAEELFDITGDATTYYYRFNTVPLSPLVDNHRSSNLRSLAKLYLRPYNQWFWKEAREIERIWCVASAYERYGRVAAELIDHWVKKMISDSLVKNLNPSSRRVQERWLDSDRQVTHTTNIASQLAHKIDSVNSRDVLEAIQRPAAFLDRLPVKEALLHDTGKYDLEYFFSDSPRKIPSKQDIQKRRQKKKSVLKKSSSFLTRLIGQRDVSMFVSGKEIRVEGQRYIFSISKGSFAAEYHGALNISVYDSKTEIRMFNLCWYVDNTPALDQLSALVMAVRAGDEDEIIQVANLLSINQEAFREHEHLMLLVPEDKHQVFTAKTIPLFQLAVEEPRVMSIFSGYHVETEDFYHHHPEVYLDFARRSAKRFVPHKFPESLSRYYKPDHPTTVRRFVNGTVGRDLLPHVVPQVVLPERTTLIAA